MLRVTFPISGVHTYWFVPPFVAFVISFFTSMGGVSGAFLLLPFQMSVLGFTTPSVSSTNFLYNLVGIPAGVYRYIKEGRMAWPLAACMVFGTFPGVLLGYIIRVKYLPDPREFKFFVGLVLLYIGYRLIRGIRKNPARRPSNITGEFRITDVRFSLTRMSFRFMKEEVSFNFLAVFFLSLVVGVIGGIYGIGGGSIIAPILVSIFDIPVYVVSGAVLLGTFMTSVSGLVFYSLITLNGTTAPPDWALGILFGIGGLFGMYFGARAQRYFNERTIKLILAFVILLVSLRYILQFFK
ncbi:MAG: sulfite exporter TauE/SafE family protein [Nitrospirae bacterium]|nr:sulfite exporter TauE/SafE family protein [Nitrospirota bacterium]